jgi:hypothetical protein
VLPVVQPIGGGIEVHQAQLTAGVRRVDADGQVTQAVRALPPSGNAWFTGSTGLTRAALAHRRAGAPRRLLASGRPSPGITAKEVMHLLSVPSLAPCQ